jgi:Tfp pilus assembly protein PilF
MKKKTFVLSMFFLLATLAYSQDWTGQGRQVGYVYDEEGNPLQGVKVKLMYTVTQSGLETTTDKKGKWVAMGIKGGEWFVDFELSGYLPKKISITVLDFRQKNPQIDVTLEKAEGLVVSDNVKEEYLQGTKLFEGGQYEEAIAIFESILEKYPDIHIINYDIGNAYFQMDRYDEAEQYYLKVLEKEPDNVHSLMGVGNCYINRGNNEKALEWYNKIEFEKIDDATVLYNIGTIFYNSSKFDEAMKFYKKAVEIHEDSLDARYQLGLSYLAIGNNPEALKEFENYLKYDSESERATQVKGFIEYLKRR